MTMKLKSIVTEGEKVKEINKLTEKNKTRECENMLTIIFKTNQKNSIFIEKMSKTHFS